MASRARSAPSREAGQTVPFLLLLLVLTLSVALLLGALGQRAVEAASARTAADAAALAGAVAGESEARATAAANGGELVRFAVSGRQAEVEVRVGSATATARAERQHVAAGDVAAPPEGAAGLHPELVAALERAERLLGEPVPITSGFRSRADQERLWAQRHQNPFPVAPPGTSRHELGLAIDVPRSFVGRLRSVAHAVGLCFPLPVTDPVHFELCPGAG